MNYKISICISTWCRKDNLEKIIELLESQSVSQDEYEIIVCDSSSNDGTIDLMSKLTNKYSNLKYINVPKNVLAAKRNYGINNSTSPIVIFIDDDVFPNKNFIEAHLLAHENVENTVFCGQVRFPEEWVNRSNYYRFRDSRLLNEKHSKLFDNLPFNKIVVMNLSFKKEEIIKKTGLLDERFIGYGGEDTEFGFRIVNSGLKLVYLEDAIAYHKEKSVSIDSYGEKILRAGRDGSKVLNLINPNIINNTNLRFFDSVTIDKKLSYRYKKIFYNLVVNKYFAALVAKFLIMTDSIKLAYIEKLYIYYVAFKYKEGVSLQEEFDLTLNDAKTGWYK